MTWRDDDLKTRYQDLETGKDQIPWEPEDKLFYFVVYVTASVDGQLIYISLCLQKRAQWNGGLLNNPTYITVQSWSEQAQDIHNVMYEQQHTSDASGLQVLKSALQKAGY
ncbi:hypothetical protein BU15DRAFT_63509 [Melanogaster broomeanus]|nr:hypothetical protein BU15DRAFT_63509 [Melanogaster broomeanus]